MYPGDLLLPRRELFSCLFVVRRRIVSFRRLRARMPDDDRYVIQSNPRLPQLIRERSTKVIGTRELHGRLTLCRLDDRTSLLANPLIDLADPLGGRSPVQRRPFHLKALWIKHLSAATLRRRFQQEGLKA